MTEPVVIAFLAQTVPSVVAAIAATVAAWWAHKGKENTKNLQDDTKAVRSQVENSHATNLRGDIDELKDSILHLHDRLTTHISREDGENRRLWNALNKRK